MCWSLPGVETMVLFHGRYDRPFIEHSHDDATIVYVSEGRVAVEIEGETHSVGPGMMAVIGPHQIHAARPASRGGWRMRSAQVALRDLGFSEWTPSRPGFIDRPVRDAFDPFTRRFVALHQRAESPMSMEIGSGVSDAARALQRELVEMFAPVGDDDPNDPLVAARGLLIGSEFRDAVLPEIAEAVGLSEFGLVKQFRRRFGISPHRWRLQNRANDVSHLLRDGIGLADAAAVCGFSDQSHMSRTFKRVFGVTPGQFASAFVSN